MSKTLSVHPKYIQAVEQAWRYKSNGQEQELAEQLGRSLPIVINNLFLKGQPVNRLNFLQICQLLGLDWREVAGFEGQESSLTSVSSVAFNSGENQINSYFSVEKDTVDKALQDLVRTLCEMLGRITRKAGDLLSADRASIFLIDQHKKEVGSLIAEDGKGGSLIIDIPMNKGIVGLAARSSNMINIPFDVYDDPRSEQAKKTDKKTGYRTYTILAWPLLNRQKEVVAVAQFINKLKPQSNSHEDLSQRIDKKGFTSEDEFVFAKFSPSVMGILGKCQLCHQLAHKLEAKQQITRGGVVLGEDELIAELRQRAQQLRQGFAKLV
ncbi:GAF domain-containing protein [Coleofasciculus sp. F4-SAH-05]